MQISLQMNEIQIVPNLKQRIQEYKADQRLVLSIKQIVKEAR